MSTNDSGVDDLGFRALMTLAYETAGLVLSPKKSTMIRSRLRHRLKALSINDLDEYCSYVKQEPAQDELKFMISALTTNVSDFFREEHHFDHLANMVIPNLKVKIKRGQRVRIWSAGCSNGQEPYSIAILINEVCADIADEDFKILATDIDQNVLNYAMHGVYDENQISGLSADRVAQNFSEVGRKYHVNESIKKLISFRQLNLIETWPMKGKFDVIFCRNVVIYFDGATQAKLWPRFNETLQPDGVMFVGHSERINDPAFVPCGATTYCKASSTCENQNLKWG